MKRIQNEMRQRFEQLKVKQMKFLQLLAFINMMNGFKRQKQVSYKIFSLLLKMQPFIRDILNLERED